MIRIAGRSGGDTGDLVIVLSGMLSICIPAQLHVNVTSGENKDAMNNKTEMLTEENIKGRKGFLP